MERRRPTEEEIHESFIESTKRSDNLSEKEVSQKASYMLEDLDIDIETLRGKQTLDLGSGPSILERAAEAEGIDTVVSVDKRKIALSQKKDAKQGVVANAQALPISDSSIDLVVSHAGPPSIRGGLETPKEQEDGVINIFNEMERVLSPNGEARIWPPRLFFIDTRERGKIKELLEKRSKGLTDEEREEINQHYIKTSEQATQFLLENGYNIELKQRDSNKTRFGHWGYYWVLKKNKVFLDRPERSEGPLEQTVRGFPTP